MSVAAAHPAVYSMDQRPLLARPQCAQDWEDRKAVIVELYESKTLKETMKIMEEEHSFKATEKQYKKQLQKWDIDHKRIKPTDYKAMIRKKRQREEDGQKDSTFELRGVEIDDAKIVRFQKRHRISKPEQVFDCPTPPELICTTPAPIPPSPDLRLFPWYNIYEKYLDLSMAGPSTIQSNDVQSILRSLVIPFPNYEDECRSLNGCRIGKRYDIVIQNLRAGDSFNLFLALSVVDSDLDRAISAPNIHNRAFEMYQPQKLLQSIIKNSLHRLKNHSYSLSSLDAVGQASVLCAVRIAGTIHKLSGRRGEAISLLEKIRHLVEQDLELKDTNIWLSYTGMLQELAHCYAEDGHRDEARHLLNNNLEWPCSLAMKVYGRKFSKLLKDIVHNCRESALHFTQEHHAQLQEGSSQPGTSEWGPFLTDRVDWDKV